MAHIRKRGKNWSAELYVSGKTAHATFRTKQEAAAWALERTAELEGRVIPAKTLSDALTRYGAERVPASPGGKRWQKNKLANLKDDPLAKMQLTAITGPDLAQWRDARAAGPKIRGEGPVSPSTVNRELNLIGAVLKAAIEWGWLKQSPMQGLKRPKNPRARRRRITPGEVDAIVTALGYVTGPPATISQRVALAFLFALETAMRGGEIVRLQRAHIGKLSVHLPKTKNGDARDVALSVRAREIIALLPEGFQLTDAQKDSLFRKARVAAGIENLHFHDSRAEAVYRLSKKLDVLELARMIGHRNVASLMHYYESTADELAAKLG